jgi:hypothetical protein
MTQDLTPEAVAKMMEGVTGDMMQGYWVDDARAAFQPKETDQ